MYRIITILYVISLFHHLDKFLILVFVKLMGRILSTEIGISELVLSFILNTILFIS